MARSNQDDFDGYRKWLGISTKNRVPTHYEVLGISLDEEDPDVIQASAEQRRHYVGTKRGEGHDAVVTEILYRISEAESTLLNTALRRDYDRKLDLFEKREKSRQYDPTVSRSRVKSRRGRTVGEDGGIVKTFIVIMAVVVIGFGGMAWLSFGLPGSRPAKQVEPAPVAQVPAPAPAPAQVPVAPAPVAQVPVAVIAPPQSVLERVKIVEPEKPKEDAVEAEKPKDAVEGAVDDSGKSLFDGKTLKGWHGNTSFWKVKNGVIVGSNTSPAKKNTFLISDKKYKDFTLRLKFRLIEGNSGVNVRSKEQANFVVSGPQADITTDFNFLGSLTGEYMEPWMIKKTSDDIKEQLKKDVDLTAWNDMTVIAEGQSVVIKINGQTTVNAVSDNIPENGHIALQLHVGGRTTVEYKDIFLTELKSE